MYLIKRNFLIFFLAMGFCFQLHSKQNLSRLERREKSLELTTSIAIPCHPTHFKLLKNLLKRFSEQTILPDEVVVSLSEVDKIDLESLDDLTKIEWPFSFQLICTNEKKKAGENRNIACEKAKGDLLLLMDADDIPHNRRVELTKYFFENFNVDLMLHKFVKDEDDFSIEDDFLNTFDMSDIGYTNSIYYFRSARVFHSGHPSMLKDVFKKVKWTSKQRGQDVTFILDVFQCFDHIFLAPLNLSLYRKEYSTWIDELDYTINVENVKLVKSDIEQDLDCPDCWSDFSEGGFFDSNSDEEIKTNTKTPRRIKPRQIKPKNPKPKNPKPKKPRVIKPRGLKIRKPRLIKPKGPKIRKPRQAKPKKPRIIKPKKPKIRKRR